MSGFRLRWVHRIRRSIVISASLPQTSLFRLYYKENEKRERNYDLKERRVNFVDFDKSKHLHCVLIEEIETVSIIAVIGVAALCSF